MLFFIWSLETYENLVVLCYSTNWESSVLDFQDLRKFMNVQIYVKFDLSVYKIVNMLR